MRAEKSHRRVRTIPGKERLSERLRRQLGTLQGRLERAAVALADAPTPAAIHKTRVAARRLRVLLHAYSRELDSKERKRYLRELEELTGDLEPAREADVAQGLIRRLARDRSGGIDGHSRALYERARRRYQVEVDALRAIMVREAWRQRLEDLRRLSEVSSLVRDNDKSAVTVMHHLVKRRRRRLRAALAEAGNSPARLHRIRLKIKAMRYLLEGSLAKNVMAKDRELRKLRQIQNCLGDLHDEENLIKALRTERTHRLAALLLREKLERRKHRKLQAFKRHRKQLTRLWTDSTA